MQQRGARGDPGIGVALHQAHHQVAAVRAQARPRIAGEIRRVLQDGAEHLLGVGALVHLVHERQPARQQLVRHHATAPHVRLLAVVAVDHLRRHVRRRAATASQALARLYDPGQTEIGRFERRPGLVALEQEIVGLDVPEDDAAAVALRRRAKHRAHELRRIRLRVRPAPADAAQQLATLAQVHQQVHGVVVLERVVQVHHR